MRGRKKGREEEIREARDVFKKKKTNPNEKIEVWRYYWILIQIFSATLHKSKKKSWMIFFLGVE